MAVTGKEKLYVSSGGSTATVSVQDVADFASGESGSVSSVNNVAPVAGNVTLAPADLGATATGAALFTAADQASARTAIGAGTSNLVLGTAAGTALAGNGNAVSATTATTAGTCTGNAGTATTWQTGRTITLTGGATGVSGTFNGSANLSFATTLATPTGVLRGGVLQGTAVANCTVAADGTSAGTQLNALLAQLRTAGIIAP